MDSPSPENGVPKDDSSSGKKASRTEESVRKRLAALKSLMETRKKTDTNQTLKSIAEDFQHVCEQLKDSAISYYLKELHYEKVNGVYVYVEPSEVKVERQKQMTEMHRGLLKNVIQRMYKGDVFWLPLEVQPGFAEGVAASLKQVYPKKIFACIAADDRVLVACIRNAHRDFVRKDLHELTGIPAVTPETSDKVQLGGKEKPQNS